jgi:hypothetical protein
VPIGQRCDTPLSTFKEWVCRFAVVPRTFRGRRKAGKYLLHTMVELGDFCHPHISVFAKIYYGPVTRWARPLLPCSVSVRASLHLVSAPLPNPKLDDDFWLCHAPPVIIAPNDDGNRAAISRVICGQLLDDRAKTRPAIPSGLIVAVWVDQA